MSEIDDLFTAMAKAVAANDRDRFDELERMLLSHYEGDFSGMPGSVYHRYLEIDRGWPVAAQQRSPDSRSDSVTRRLGPRMLVSARLPAALLDWVQEVAVETGANRSDVLTACLEQTRLDATLRQQLVERLADDEEA